MKSKERKSNSEPSADSGLDLETKFFLGHAQRRSFSVDIPSYRTTYLRTRHFLANKLTAVLESCDFGSVQPASWIHEESITYRNDAEGIFESPDYL